MAVNDSHAKFAKLPAGWLVGQRVHTNATYAKVYPRAPKPRRGTITGGSRSSEGDIYVKFDDQKYARAVRHQLLVANQVLKER